MASYEDAKQGVQALLNNSVELESFWKTVDANGNGLASLKEVQKAFQAKFPFFSNSAALSRAFKFTTEVESDGDDIIQPYEFARLLINSIYFTHLYDKFQQFDVDGSNSLDFDEFSKLATEMGINMREDLLRSEFELMDADGSSQADFNELCRWFAIKGISVDGIEKHQFLNSSVHASANDGAVDRHPDIHTKKFAKVEKKYKKLLQDARRLKAMWNVLDDNSNGVVTMREIEYYFKYREPILYNPRALIRAYRLTTMGGDGDAFVQKHEFVPLLRNIVYFNKLFAVFSEMDKDGDHRLDMDEFMKGMQLVGLNLPQTEAEIEFQMMDADQGGWILFDEFAAWVACKHCPVDDTVVDTFVRTSKNLERKEKKPKVVEGQKTMNKKFKALEKRLKGNLANKHLFDAFWKKLDKSRDGHVTLNELHEFMAQKYPLLSRKAALKRAYVYTVKRDTDGMNGTIEKNELGPLMKNIFFFHRALHTFDIIDKDGSHAVTLDEFVSAADMFGCTEDEMKSMFSHIDVDGSGEIKLDEFAEYLIEQDS